MDGSRPHPLVGQEALHSELRILTCEYLLATAPRRYRLNDSATRRPLPPSYASAVP